MESIDLSLYPVRAFVRSRAYRAISESTGVNSEVFCRVADYVIDPQQTPELYCPHSDSFEAGGAEARAVEAIVLRYRRVLELESLVFS